MKKLLLFLALPLFCCCKSDKTTDKNSKDKTDTVNFIHINNPEYEYDNIADIVEHYKYIQKGYDLLDSTLKAIDTNNMTEEDVDWILYVCSQIHKNQTALFAHQFKLRALYCEKIRETLRKCKVREKYPVEFDAFKEEINDLSVKEDLAYSGLFLMYLTYSDTSYFQEKTK